MPAPPSDAQSMSARVVSVTPSGADAVCLAVEPERPFEQLRAARFFMLRREDELSPAIPRPFSLFRMTEGELEFLIKVTGRGTRALAQSRPGDQLRLIGPLGNGWQALSGDGKPIVMLAGGIGSAPFFMGIEQALAGVGGGPPLGPSSIHLLYGAAHAGFLYEREAFEDLGVRVSCATDDGSFGFSGNVLELLRHEWETGVIPRQVRILACGPERMLEAAQELAESEGLECWLSLETLMGCGVGICNGCPVPTRSGGAFGDWPNAKCCVEGPVFRSTDIDLRGSL